MGKSYKNKNKRNGGGSPFPLKYYDPMAPEPAAASGRDLLEAMPPLGVRAKIGGKQKQTQTQKQTRSHKRKSMKGRKGGFVPSVMNGFAIAASKYVVPITLFAGYKLMTRKGKKASRRRHTRRR